jgi:hypothetical protein
MKLRTGATRPERVWLPQRTAEGQKKKSRAGCLPHQSYPVVLAVKALRCSRAVRTALLAEWPDGQPLTAALRRGRFGLGQSARARPEKAIMSEKSHVSLERHLCLVCGAEYDTGAILLDRRLRASLDRHTTTGWGLCPEHRRLCDEGFVALVECDPARSAVSRPRPTDLSRSRRIEDVQGRPATQEKQEVTR